MRNTAINALELMGIGVFNADGTPKGASELIKEIEEIFKKNKKGDEVMTNKKEDIAVQARREFLKDIKGNLIKIKESLTYELGDSTKNGFEDIDNFLKRAILKLDICICNLKNIEEDFENKICEINKAIDALSEAIKIIKTADKTNFLKTDVIYLKDILEDEMENLSSFDRKTNESENVETTEIDSPVEEDKKENGVNKNRKEETSGKDTTTPIFNFDTEEMKEKGTYFSGVITPFYGIDFANINKELVTPFIVNPSVTLAGNKAKNEVNGNEEVEKQSFDETVLNENIETMRKEIKRIVSDKFLDVKPIEKAETITKLSKEMRKCINMKNYIEISNRHRANEDDK